MGALVAENGPAARRTAWHAVE
jgi:hypothetical protein